MENKEKYQVEFEFKSSPKILYNYISTASGLEGWFADKVVIEKNGNFTFFWGKESRTAKITSKKENQSVRFDWLDEQDTYFEFEILQDDITSEVGLLVTDFGYKSDLAQNKQLWTSQIVELRHILGS